MVLGEEENIPNRVTVVMARHYRIPRSNIPDLDEPFCRTNGEQVAIVAERRVAGSDVTVSNELVVEVALTGPDVDSATLARADDLLARGVEGDCGCVAVGQPCGWVSGPAR